MITQSKETKAARVGNTYPTLNVLLSAPETMLKQSIKDATEAKRRLDDVWCEFANCSWQKVKSGLTRRVQKGKGHT